MTRKQALAELDAFVHDPNRHQLEEKLKRCPESRKASELLGSAVLGRRGYSRQFRREDSLRLAGLNWPTADARPSLPHGLLDEGAVEP